MQGIKTVIGLDRQPTQTELLEEKQNNEVWQFYPGSGGAGPRASGATRSAMMPALAHEVTKTGAHAPPNHALHDGCPTRWLRPPSVLHRFVPPDVLHTVCFLFMATASPIPAPCPAVQTPLNDSV